MSDIAAGKGELARLLSLAILRVDLSNDISPTVYLGHFDFTILSVYKSTALSALLGCRRWDLLAAVHIELATVLLPLFCATMCPLNP